MKAFPLLFLLLRTPRPSASPPALLVHASKPGEPPAAKPGEEFVQSSSRTTTHRQNQRLGSEDCRSWRLGVHLHQSSSVYVAAVLRSAPDRLSASVIAHV